MFTEFNSFHYVIINLDEVIQNCINNPDRQQLLTEYKIHLDLATNTIILNFINRSDLKPIYLLNNQLGNYNLLIKIDPNLNLTIIEHQTNQSNHTNIICSQNSITNYYLIQEQTTTTLNIIQHYQSQLNGVLLANPKLSNNLKCQINLIEAKANAVIGILQNPQPKVKNLIELLIKHQGSNTFSNTNIRNLAPAQAVAKVIGKIMVTPNAEDTVANLHSKGLILENQGNIIVDPELIIENNQVMCTHGVTIGNLDPMAILYLGSRGVSVIEANRILLNAFQEPIIKMIKHQEIINYINKSAYYND